MDLSHIHFHDTQILRVVEDPAADILTMEVNYPVDWDNNVFERRSITFLDSYNYQVHEGPFSGVPTILTVEIIETDSRWTRLRIQTNAGFREISCVSISLERKGPGSLTNRGSEQREARAARAIATGAVTPLHVRDIHRQSEPD